MVAPNNYAPPPRAQHLILIAGWEKMIVNIIYPRDGVAKKKLVLYYMYIIGRLTIKIAT